MRILHLVCEGRCGAPHTQNFDNALKERDRYAVNRLARRLVHTEHIAKPLERRGWLGREIFECMECGHKREFGWPASGVHVAEPASDFPVEAIE